MNLEEKIKELKKIESEKKYFDDLIKSVTLKASYYFKDLRTLVKNVYFRYDKNNFSLGFIDNSAVLYIYIVGDYYNFSNYPLYSKELEKLNASMPEDWDIL